MNETDQTSITRNRTRLAVRLGIYGMMAGITATFLFGLNSIGQWDVSTGRSRTVTTVIGVPVWYHEPRPTMMSDWLSEPAGKEFWIHVRGPYRRNAKVTSCEMSLLQEMHGMGLPIKLSESVGGLSSKRARAKIARLVLDELRRTESICRVYDHAREFGAQLSQGYWDKEASLTEAALQTLWNNAQPSEEESL